MITHTCTHTYIHTYIGTVMERGSCWHISTRLNATKMSQALRYMIGKKIDFTTFASRRNTHLALNHVCMLESGGLRVVAEGMCLYVCVYISHTHIHMRVYNIHIYTCMFIHTYVQCVYLATSTISRLTHTHTCIHMHTYAYIHTYIHPYIHTYSGFIWPSLHVPHSDTHTMHTYIHTFIHTVGLFGHHDTFQTLADNMVSEIINTPLKEGVTQTQTDFDSDGANAGLREIINTPLKESVTQTQEDCDSALIRTQNCGQKESGDAGLKEGVTQTQADYDSDSADAGLKEQSARESGTQTQTDSDHRVPDAGLKERSAREGVTQTQTDSDDCAQQECADAGLNGDLEWEETSQTQIQARREYIVIEVQGDRFLRNMVR
jgi:hypothetical protein